MVIGCQLRDHSDHSSGVNDDALVVSASIIYTCWLAERLLVTELKLSCEELLAGVGALCLFHNPKELDAGAGP